MRPRPRPHDHAPLPAWIWIPAGLGLLFVLLPLAGMLSRVDFTGFLGLVTAPSSLDALGLSLLTALAATAGCVLLGVPTGLVLARADFPGLQLVRSLLLLPLVLPPVVGGLALLYTFGKVGLLGRYLVLAGIDIAFTTVAVVMAQIFVALPFMIMTVEGAARTHGTRFERVAAGLGAAPGFVFRHVTLPLLRPALLSGTVLCFARTLGEFGATLTFAGSLQGVTRTLPLEIYLQREADPAAAVALSLLLIGFALLVVVISYRIPATAEAMPRIRRRADSAASTAEAGPGETSATATGGGP